MSATDDALKSLTSALLDVTNSLNSVLDDEQQDHKALDDAHSQITNLETQLKNLQSSKESSDASTATAINSLTSNLQELAKKALAAVPAKSSDSTTTETPTPPDQPISDQSPVSQAFNTP